MFLLYFLNLFIIPSVNLVTKIGQLTLKMDAVIIVTLTTGMISILGVVFNSIVSKILEYRQSSKRYLYEKRETIFRFYRDSL